jgi:formate-dependent nitrite reductase cytochrome c552 subunit
MAANRRVYPPKKVWDVMRQERLEAVGYVCEDCGMPDASEFFNAKKPHPFYEQGTPYRVYLNLAHKRQYETWNREADVMLLCPSCHATFDAEHRRKRSAHRNAPVGVVVLWVNYKGQRCLAAEARYMNDLFEVIATFTTGTRFEVVAEMLMHEVGMGRYRRTDEGVMVLREKGACVSYGELLQEVLLGVVG